jgi:tetratricopeptide (TPR) repeat protein
MGNGSRSPLEDVLERLGKRDHYALLGVSPEVSVDAIKEVYLELVRHYHPDLFKDADRHAAAKRVSEALVDAWLTLSDPVKRAAYDRQRAGKGVHVPKLDRDLRAEAELARMLIASPAAIGSRRVEVAKALHQRGAVLFSRREYAEAERYLRRALELDPSVPEHSLRLGWALFNNRSHPDTVRLHEARALIGHGVAKDPYNADARYSFACICREMGQHDQYRHELEAAMRGRTAHPRAKEELAALDAKEARHEEAVRRYEQAKADESGGFSLKRLWPWTK